MDFFTAAKKFWTQAYLTFGWSLFNLTTFIQKLMQINKKNEIKCNHATKCTATVSDSFAIKFISFPVQSPFNSKWTEVLKSFESSALMKLFWAGCEQKLQTVLNIKSFISLSIPLLANLISRINILIHTLRDYNVMEMWNGRGGFYSLWLLLLLLLFKIEQSEFFVIKSDFIKELKKIKKIFEKFLGSSKNPHIIPMYKSVKISQ